MKPVTIGLIGLGTAGMRHGTAIRKSPLGKIVGAADPAPKAAAAAGSLEAPYFSDYETMLREANPDAVVISLPHYLLCDAALAAARHGKHVFLEKPMGATLEQAQVVERACAEVNVKLMVNFVHRFRAESRQAWNAIRAGAIGKVILVVDSMTSGYSGMPPWVWDKEKSGGGIMMYNGVHSIDRMIWLAGAPVTQVTAATGTLAYPVDTEDTLVGTMQFENGVLGSIVQHKSQAQVTLSGWHTTVYGTNGALQFTSGENFEIASDKEKAKTVVTEDDRFLGAFIEFATAIQENRTPSPSGVDGVHALETAFALYEASNRGQRVAVESRLA